MSNPHAERELQKLQANIREALQVIDTHRAELTPSLSSRSSKAVAVAQAMLDIFDLIEQALLREGAS